MYIIKIEEDVEIGGDGTEYGFVDITVRINKKSMVFLHGKHKEDAAKFNKNIERFHLGKCKLEQD